MSGAVINTGSVYSGAVVSDITINKYLNVYNTAQAYDVAVKSGGSLYVDGGAYAANVEIFTGGSAYISGGSASGVYVSSGASIGFYNGYASDVTMAVGAKGGKS